MILNVLYFYRISIDKFLIIWYTYYTLIIYLFFFYFLDLYDNYISFQKIYIIISSLFFFIRDTLQTVENTRVQKWFSENVLLNDDF